jgi:hypothetical protein
LQVVPVEFTGKRRRNEIPDDQLTPADKAARETARRTNAGHLKNKKRLLKVLAQVTDISQVTTSKAEKRKKGYVRYRWRLENEPGFREREAQYLKDWKDKTNFNERAKQQRLERLKDPAYVAREREKNRLAAQRARDKKRQAKQLEAANDPSQPLEQAA